MEIHELNKRPNIEQNIKLNKKFIQFEKLIFELKTKEIPNEIVIFINKNLEEINSLSYSEKELKKQINKTQTKILKLIEKELSLVTKNHYRNTWFILGMAIGVGICMSIGSSSGNTSLLAVGIPLGFTIGIAIGTSKDKKAKDNGLQLDIEIKN
jgi:hypothetical protein